MWTLAGSLSSLDWIAWPVQIGLLAADSRHPGLDRGRVRLRRTQCAADANRDPSRLTAAYPASRKPLAGTRRRSPARRAHSKPSCQRPPRWTRSRRRQPESLTRSLAAYRSPPSVQFTPRVLIHQALSRSDRLARPHGVMSSGDIDILPKTSRHDSDRLAFGLARLWITWSQKLHLVTTPH